MRIYPDMAIDKLFSSLTQSPGVKGAIGGAASGALVALLMNEKTRKKVGKGAVQLGGMAALAGVGYYAYQKWQNSKAVAAASNSGTIVDEARPVAAPSGPVRALPELPPVSDLLGMKMILAMIAAANADGTIDAAEMEHLFESIENATLSPAEKATLTAALSQSPTIEEIALGLDSEAQRSEVYGAALTAIDLDSPAEHLFLRRLAASLKLEPDLVAAIHKQFD